MNSQKIKIDIDLNYTKFIHTPLGLYLKRTDRYFVRKLPDECEFKQFGDRLEIEMDLNFFRKNNIKRFLYDASRISEENKSQRLQTGLEDLLKSNLVDSIRTSDIR